MIRKLAAAALVALAVPLVATASASAPVTILVKEDTTSYVARTSYAMPVEFDESYGLVPSSVSAFGFKVVSTKLGQVVKLRWTLGCSGERGSWSQRGGTVEGKTEVTVWRSINADDSCVATIVAHRERGSTGRMLVTLRAR